MKLSAFALGTMLAAGLSATAQVAQQSSIPTDTMKKVQKPKAKIMEKYHQSGVEKEVGKAPEKKHQKRYCPTCGRG